MTKTRENRHTHNSLPDASRINTALTTGSQVMGFWIQKVLLFSPGIVWFRFSTRNYGFSFVGFRSFNVTDICHHHVAAVVMMWVPTSDGSGFEFFFKLGSGIEIFSRYWFYLKLEQTIHSLYHCSNFRTICSWVFFTREKINESFFFWGWKQNSDLFSPDF